MSATQALPWFAGLAPRLHIINGDDFPFLVLAAVDPKDATPAALTRLGGLSAFLSHDEGRTWPDPEGEALARAVVEGGGVACFAFVKLVDALALHRRITGGRTT